VHHDGTADDLRIERFPARRVFLKSLTLRGFKSFADKTVLDFEPGITVIVGPNGSGKSNVVDAISWVLGEQGTKSLRSGRMEDVIFAGTASRPPLGRSEVSLTIDNSANLLPIDFAEVTIARLLYRSGESEYSINGTPCRLLDVQELLSDSGIGRELHTIVGQNRLEDVLQGRPEDRRAAIEEAAGIYKHRRRKEKALRKLAGMEQHLVRLSDLVGELRRQLKPLQQQAEAARKAAEVQAELREVRLVLRSRELSTARQRAGVLEAEEERFNARLAELEATHQTAQAEESRLQAILDEQQPMAARATQTAHELDTVRERLRGTMALAEERARHLAQPLADEEDARSPADLEREATEVLAELGAADAELAAAKESTATAEAARARARQALAAHDQAVAGAERDRARAHQHEVRLAGKVAGLERTIEQFQSESGRLDGQARGLQRRQEELARQLDALREEAAELEREQAVRAEALAAARAEHDRQAAETKRLRAEERRLEGERAAAKARREAFEATARAAGGDALAVLEGAGLQGLVGPLTQALSVEPGLEAAAAAALGADADAIVVASGAAAGAAAATLRDAGGRAILLHPAPEPAVPAARPEPPQAGAGPAQPSLSHPAPGPAGPGPSQPAVPHAGEGRLLEHVTAGGAAGEVARALLDGVLLASGLDEARDLAARFPDHRVVTAAGELVAAGRVEGGTVPRASGLAARRAAEEAAAAERLALEAVETLGAELEAAEQALEHLESRVAAAASRHREAEAATRAAADRDRAADKEHRGLEREATAVDRRRREVAAAREQATTGLATAQAGLDALRTGGEAGVPLPDPEARLPLAVAADQAEQVAVAARVAGAATGERHRMLTERLHDLRDQARSAAEAAERRARVRAARLDGAHRAGEAARLASATLTRLERSLASAVEVRDRLAGALASARSGLTDAGARRREAAAALDEHHAATRESDSARVEARLKVEELSKRMVEEFAVDPDEALKEYLPDEATLARLDEADPRRQQTTELRRVATALDRRLALLGRVNPLALEEFKALEERYTFLSGQLQDLKESRRDLLKVVRAVDERVREVFGQAFGDVAREFDRTFRLLFPGGEGRLVLTDPEDILNSGVEVEARPPGKKVKRLQLLSGGERSLVALAFCFAVFRARPSPFYVLDEVEAALDDVNLHRFLDLLEDAREHAQLLVVSHQRRTMEAGDALYGVSMQGSGVSKVVSQRLREDRKPGRAHRAETLNGKATGEPGGGTLGEAGHDDAAAGDRSSPVEVK
jgi:chromosome segregation protein